MAFQPIDAPNPPLIPSPSFAPRNTEVTWMAEYGLGGQGFAPSNLNTIKHKTFEKDDKGKAKRIARLQALTLGYSEDEW